jgi:hypothetical protein
MAIVPRPTQDPKALREWVWHRWQRSAVESFRSRRFDAQEFRVGLDMFVEAVISASTYLLRR